MFLRLLILLVTAWAVECTYSIPVTWIPRGLQKASIQSQLGDFSSQGTLIYAEYDSFESLDTSDAVHFALGLAAAAGLPCPLTLSPGTQAFVARAPAAPGIALWLPTCYPSMAIAPSCDLDRRLSIHADGVFAANTASLELLVTDNNIHTDSCDSPAAVSNGINTALVSGPVSLAPYFLPSGSSSSSVLAPSTVLSVDGAIFTSLPGGQHSITLTSVPFTDYAPAGDVAYYAAATFTWPPSGSPSVCPTLLVRRPMPDFSMPLNAAGMCLAGVLPAAQVLLLERPATSSAAARLVQKMKDGVRRGVEVVKTRIRREDDVNWSPKAAN